MPILKRIFDLIATIPALFLLSPILVLIAIIARFFIGSPVLFRQQRPGLNGKPFVIYKFRTMTNARNEYGELLSDTDRLTRFGRFLRSTSFDELPELLNVLKGDMSLVGPRPLLMQYLKRYTPEQARRHETKPGITGWAQINGRNNILFSKRLSLDVWYIENWSLWLDLKIIFLTVISVFKREGVRTDFEQCISEVDDCGLSDDLPK
jgi:sugar transferase EpsL